MEFSIIIALVFMEISIIIAIAAVAYIMAVGKNQQEQDLEQQELEEALQEAAELAQLERTEATDLAISFRLSISSIADTLWNCFATWTITNNGSQTYYVSDIRSTFSLAGYKVNTWIPGNRDMVLIKPGETKKIHCSVNDKKLWATAKTCSIVRDAILAKLGVEKLRQWDFNYTPGKKQALSSLIYVDSTSFKLSSPYADAENTIDITSEIPSALEYLQSVKVYERFGSNAQDWK